VCEQANYNDLGLRKGHRAKQTNARGRHRLDEANGTHWGLTVGPREVGPRRIAEPAGEGPVGPGAEVGLGDRAEPVPSVGVGVVGVGVDQS
jgi:hypothetical protein